MYQEATGEHAIISQNDVDLFMNSIEPLYRAVNLCALLAVLIMALLGVTGKARFLRLLNARMLLVVLWTGG